MSSPETDTDITVTSLLAVGFSTAAHLWLKTREGHIAPRTLVDYARYVKTLSAFFGEMRLNEITPDQIRAYQQMRQATCSGQVVNKEICILSQMRQRIGQPLRDYQPLRVAKDWESPGRALSESEDVRLTAAFKAAADHPQWIVAACASLLSKNTTAGPGEILALRMKDVELDAEPPRITIPPMGAKNIRRSRVIPLNETAKWAAERLWNRALDCGAFSGEHYLIPYRNRDHSYDPTRPGKGWKSALRELLAVSGIKMRAYDFRHHAVTKLLENPEVSEQTAVAMAGWISPRMKRRYSHTRMVALAVAAAALDGQSGESCRKQAISLKRREIKNDENT